MTQYILRGQIVSEHEWLSAHRQPSPRHQVRLRISDLADAACVLCVVGEFRVLAAGVLWATLSLSEDQCEALARRSIAWTMDR